MDQEVCQKVFLLPQSLLKKDGTAESNNMTIIRLKHPRTGQSSMFALSSERKQIFEILQFSESFCSWFIEDKVEKDGSLFLMTPADPLFFILPYLIQESRYCPMEDVLVDENNLDVKQLLSCCSQKDLENIADFKDAGVFVYRYSKKKTMQWLKKKVLTVTAAMKAKNISLSDGSKVSSLVQRKSSSHRSEDAYSHSACQLVSEYLPDAVSKELFNTLGFQEAQSEEKDQEKEVNGQAQKKLKTEPVEPTEDYSKQENPDALQSKQKNKMTLAQKQLLKADKTGMKSISSFFQKK